MNSRDLATMKRNRRKVAKDFRIHCDITNEALIRARLHNPTLMRSPLTPSSSDSPMCDPSFKRSRLSLLPSAEEGAADALDPAHLSALAQAQKQTRMLRASQTGMLASNLFGIKRASLMMRDWRTQKQELEEASQRISSPPPRPTSPFCISPSTPSGCEPFVREASSAHSSESGSERLPTIVITPPPAPTFNSGTKEGRHCASFSPDSSPEAAVAKSALKSAYAKSVAAADEALAENAFVDDFLGMRTEGRHSETPVSASNPPKKKSFLAALWPGNWFVKKKMSERQPAPNAAPQYLSAGTNTDLKLMEQTKVVQALKVSDFAGKHQLVRRAFFKWGTGVREGLRFKLMYAEEQLAEYKSKGEVEERLVEVMRERDRLREMLVEGKRKVGGEG